MAAKRLLVSIEEDVLNEIMELARNRKISSSKCAGDLIKASLELEEDKLFSKLADKRLNETQKWISHDDAWK